MSDNNIRIKTTPDGTSSNVNLSINQKFDFIEILSLKISQKEVYRRFSSDYGVVIGRVIINNGFGVPNAKVSIFIPIDDDDKLDPEILGLYPFEVITDKDSDGIPYNLMTKSPRGKDDCFTTIGTFPNKREIQDNPDIDQIYQKYYKFTTTTNESGDYMLFGIPVGNHYLHVDADISDIGIISQRPYDLISQGVDKNKFYSGSKFKDRDADSNITQLKSVSPISVNIIPFWGDPENGEIGITRVDSDLRTTIIPSSIFMGSIITDDEKDSVNKNCRPRKKLGRMDEVVTNEGRVEMIRYNIDGSITQFDVEGGQVIDEDGTWAYQIPMNLDHKITAEDGTLIPSDDPTKGIPTRARVRFKVDMDTTGGDGRLRTRAKYLVPHNPDNWEDSDYTFNSTTRDKFFTDLHWNKIYTIKNHITRTQPNKNVENRNFIGIKDVDEGGQHNPFPFNKMDTKTNPLFVVICIILSIILAIVCLINKIIIKIINFIFRIINAVLYIACKAVFAISKFIASVGGIFLSSSKKRKLRRKGCMGCCEDGNCNGCDCNNIVPYLPYITMKCEDEYFAPCGKNGGYIVDGCSCDECQEGGWLSELTMEATVQKFDQEDPGDEPAPTNNEDGSTCDNTDPELPPDLILHYEGDCHCHDKTIILNIFPIDDAGLLDCILLQIAERLNVFKFDFYNDWVNGTLYAFLLKYKNKKNANPKFCDTNKTYSNNIVDSCTEALPQDPGANEGNIGPGYGVDSSKDVSMHEGYVVRVDGNNGKELFYSAHSRRTQYKLYATEIVSLGSIFDCDWQGVPKIYPWLIETTYNMPPLIAEWNRDPEGNDDTDVVEVSGFDTNICEENYTPLIGHINCIGLNTGAKQCNNIKRLSELGMGLDENRTDTNNTTDVNNAITNKDVDNPFIRGAFIYANKKDEFNLDSIPLTYIDSTDYPTNWLYDDEYYAMFRNPTTTNTIWQYDNSFYFYFGLRTGKTALNKMISKFFPPCIPEKDTDFFVIATDIVEDDEGEAPTGEIYIEVFGGIAPFTYMWTGPVVDGIQYPVDNTAKDVIELYVGTYNLVVSDSVGNFTEGTFVVPGPPSVNCEIQTIPVSTNGGDDGEIIVSIFSGVAPFIIQLWNYTTNTLIEEVSDVWVNSHVFDNNIVSGQYEIIVTDDGTPTTTCGGVVTVTEPSELTLIVTGQGVTCFGDNNGNATANVSGGQSPYTFSWSNGSVSQTISNLSPDEYSVIVTESGGQSTSGSYTVESPVEFGSTVDSFKNVSCYDDGTPGNSTYDGEIEISITNTGGGTGPFFIRLEGGSEGVDITSTNINHTFSNLPHGSDNTNNPYTVTVGDSLGCGIGTSVDVYRPTSPFGGYITLDGVTLTAYAYDGFGDTEDSNGDIIGSYHYTWWIFLDGSWQVIGGDTDTITTILPSGIHSYRCDIKDYNGTGGQCVITSETESG
tara:strand:+ start:57984 stop:62291 length:4308 start_codon:yes stop_codon:yes gene_type:complete